MVLKTNSPDETAAQLLDPERHEFNEKREQPVRFMSMTGG
jgi:hypothetical protein